MTEIAKEFMDGVNLNDYVKIRYGTIDNQDLVEGTIIKLSENFLYLQERDGGTIKIRLDDSLRSLKIIAQGGVASGKVSFRNLRQSVKLDSAPPYEYAAKEWLDNLRKLVKSLSDANLKNNAAGVLSSFDNAHKAGELAYKYHDIRAKILLMWDDCNTASDYEFFYLSLGILSLTAGEYEYACEPLVRAKKYVLAAYSAGAAKKSNDADVFTICALLSGESSDITLNTAEILIKWKDAEVIKRLLDMNIDNVDTCEKIMACAVKMFAVSGGNLSSDISQGESAHNAARKIVAAMPGDWKKNSSILKRWDEYSKYSYPRAVIKSPKTSSERLTGRIYRYMSNRNFGFISPGHYFHIRQVYDNTDAGILLRKILQLNLWNQLEVYFKLGKSIRDPNLSAASNIELTEEGYNEALKRLNQGESLSNGFIEAFYPKHRNGRIICSDDGQVYNFATSDISDPYLKAYYENSISRSDQAIIFKISGLGRAIDIRWKNPSPEDFDAYSAFVSDESRRAWENFLAEQRTAQKSIPLPDEDPYRLYFYCSLPEWTGDTSYKKPLPLTWNLKTDKPVSPPSEPKVSENYAENGRRAIYNSEFDKAEKYFKSALQANGFNEAVFNDLISLYIRWEGKTDLAIDLINRYETRLTKEKLLNSKIRVYEKRREYTALTDLYEEGIRNTVSVPKRSHYLFLLIGNYMNIKNYEEALRACQRWEFLYQQNQFSAETEKLKNRLTDLNRRKAMCLFCIGRIDEAQAIATDLMRSNPLDETARQILSGNLSDGIMIETNHVGEDNFEDKSELHDFIKHMIEQVKISANLKSTYLQGEDYIGDKSNFKKDVDMLVLGRRDRRSTENIKRTAETRSRNLFAACKLVKQFEQRGEDTPFNLSELAGRAIASWGDHMITQCNQIDTPRMAYLYAIEILHTSEEQDFCNAFNRYLRSFFLARRGNDSLENYISRQSNSGKNDGINTSIFANEAIPPVLAHEFLIGMLQLILSLNKIPRLKTTLINDLYGKDAGLKETLVGELSAFLDTPEADSGTEFERQINSAATLLENKMDLLRNKLFEVSRQFMESPLSEEMSSVLEISAWQKYLNNTDAGRFNGITAILKIIQDYYNGVNFDNRDDCLSRAIFNMNELINTIEQEPTDLSYNSFKPQLEQMRVKILDEQTSLYRKFQPRLTWREEIQPFRTPEGKIQIQLIVHNELNCQTAYALKIMNVEGVSGTVVSNLKIHLNDATLRGGEETEIGFSIEIDESSNQSGNFSISLAYSYKCNDSPQNPITRDRIEDFNFVIYNEDFQRLENPFSSYEGKVMDDVKMFFGRTNEIEQIVNMICPNGDGAMNYGRAIAMYGQTRTGKSSLLFHLKRKLKERYGDRIWIWDVGNIGENPIESGSSGYLPIFLYSLLSAAINSADNNPEISAIIGDENLKPPLDDILDKPNFAAAIFNNYMKRISRVLEREQKIIVMFFDEFTYLHKHIKQGTISPEFMKFWKAMLQDYCVFAVIAGQDDMLEFMRENQNEFACMEPRKLTYLDEYSAKQLIREPLEYSNRRKDLFGRDGTIEEIYRLTAGSAYLIIILCSKLVDYLNGKGAYKITKGILNDFLETRVFCVNSVLTEEIHFEPQFKERGHEEFESANKAILLSIARKSKNTGFADISSITCGDLSAQEIKELVERLVDRNVLIRKNDSQYCIQVKLLEKWLIRTKGE